MNPFLSRIQDADDDAVVSVTAGELRGLVKENEEARGLLELFLYHMEPRENDERWTDNATVTGIFRLSQIRRARAFLNRKDEGHG